MELRLITLQKYLLIQSYARSYNTAIIFLSETFSLDSSIEASDPNIIISGYNSLRSDHP